MSTKEKLLAKLRQNPKNVSFKELQQLLISYGFELARSKGSHHIFRNGDIRLTIPRAKPVKPPYVRQAIQAIDTLNEKPSEE